MKILHICNDFCYSKVHAELYFELDRLGEEQVIYTYPLSPLKVGTNNGREVLREAQCGQ